jgi:hypothetical protein
MKKSTIVVTRFNESDEEVVLFFNSLFKQKVKNVTVLFFDQSF